MRRTLRKAGRDMLDVKAAHAVAGAMVAERAVHTAPFTPGSHLLATTVRFSATKNAAIIRAGNNKAKGNPDRVPYANVIHWWNRDLTPQPWISDAATATESTWIPEYHRAIEQALDQVRGT